jgi:hypothetical protein
MISLVENGLRDRFPQECGSWLAQKKAFGKHVDKTTQEKEKQMQEQLMRDFRRLETSLRRELVEKVVEKLPYVSRTFLSTF